MALAVDGEGDYHAADLDFHETIIVGSNNQFLRQLVPLIANTLRVSFSLSVVSMDTARDSLSSTLASRRRERPALWQDSGFFQDSFFGSESRSDSGAASEFGSIGSILRGGVSTREVGAPPAGDDTADGGGPRTRH